MNLSLIERRTTDIQHIIHIRDAALVVVVSGVVRKKILYVDVDIKSISI